MEIRYLNRIPLDQALREQEFALKFSRPTLFGFECDPVITHGVRGSSEDVADAGGFSSLVVDRGGQTTLHNPGQLVVFPVVDIRDVGVKAWIQRLNTVTVECLRLWNIEAAYDYTRPGLYTFQGKIMACGVRIRGGWSTHGLAINVCNNLADFRRIRACGQVNSAMDRIGKDVTPLEVFERWADIFKRC